MNIYNNYNSYLYLIVNCNSYIYNSYIYNSFIYNSYIYIVIHMRPNISTNWL